MENINSISPITRDELLIQNIGKYNQIEERLIYPIGSSYNIYNTIPIKKESIIPNGLLDYINNNKIIDKKGELEETIFLPNNFVRGTTSINLEYDNIQPQKYSYLEGYTYNDPKDKNWVSMGVQTAIGYAIGDSVGINLTGGGIDIVSTSLETSTSLITRLAELASEEIGMETSNSDLVKIGMKVLATQFANSVVQKTRISEGINDFFSKSIGFYDAIDTLDFEKMGNIKPPSGFIGIASNMLPMYFYTEIKNDKTSEYKNGERTDYSWVNKVGFKKTDAIDYESGSYSGSNTGLVDENENPIKMSLITSSTQSLLNKTQKLFQNGKIETMISEISRIKSDGDKDISENNIQSRGRNLTQKYSDSNFCRVWTATNKYNRLSSLIRPFNENNTTKLNRTLESVRPGFESLKNYGVLQDNGFVKITPYNNDDFSVKKDQREVKKYMFSIENLAWKDSLDTTIEGTSQEGPNGGRIMWFPPYDISFNETTSVNWNQDVFIGRGEPVYTYTNTERSGTLNFKVIVDHPSILNYYNRDGVDIDGKIIDEDDYLRFFAGCDVLELKNLTKPTPPPTPPTPLPSKNPPKTVTFKVYFPNNYSGIKDGYFNTLSYLISGTSCSFTGGTGYENEIGEWKGLTPSGATVGCYFDNTYFYIADTKQSLTGNQYKDTRSFGLNNNKDNLSDPNSYSFREVYNFIESSTMSVSAERETNESKQRYINQYVYTNDKKIDAIKATGTEEYEVKKALYEQENIMLLQYEKLNPGGVISVSKMKTDPNTGKLIFSANTSMENLQSKWSTYNNQLNIVNLNLAKYLVNKTDPLIILQLNSSITLLDTYGNSLKDAVNQLVLSGNEKTYNDFYQTLKDATEIAIIGSASKHGKESDNTMLADNRAKIIKNWLLLQNKDENVYKLSSAYNQANQLSNKDTSSKEAKSDRFVYVVITTEPTGINIENEANKIGYTTIAETKNTGDEFIMSPPLRMSKSMYGYYYDKYSENSPEDKLKNDESKFFKKIEETSIGEIIKGKLSEKIKYFHPAFHSTTPEGFNSRLTFLHQCTRQGPTSEATSLTNNKRSATNMAFGRPPICVLRIGDFYNTKVIFESLNIDFDPLVWDLNQEGIGVQPMIATVSMNFKFIGGSDLTGPIARLQNAITFNFFANTGVYDDRNDRITSHSTLTGDTYDNLYNTNVYKSRVTKLSKTNINTDDTTDLNGINNRNDRSMGISPEEIETDQKRSEEKDIVAWSTNNYDYQLIKNGPKKYIVVKDKNGITIPYKSESMSASNEALFEEAKLALNDK